MKRWNVRRILEIKKRCAQPSKANRFLDESEMECLVRGVQVCVSAFILSVISGGALTLILLGEIKQKVHSPTLPSPQILFSLWHEP